MKDPQPGMKVEARLHGKKVPAIVLGSRFSPKGNYKDTELLIAQKHELSGKWIVSHCKEPIPSYKLTRRITHIDGLDYIPRKRDRT